MKKFDILTTANEAMNDIKIKGEQCAPTALVVAGVVGFVAAGVLACRATLKAPKTVEKQKIRLEALKEKKEVDILDDKQYRKELSKEYFHCTMEWVKLYAPSVIIAGLSAGMIFESNGMMKKRNASLAAAYATLDGAFKKYRKNVVDKYGKEEDQRLMTGAKEETIEVEETDPETGKVKKKKVKANVLDPNDIENWQSYARIMGDFPQDSIHHCKAFCTADPDMSFNTTQAELAQNYMNDRLVANGAVTLNELYEELGFKRTKAGYKVGWVYNSEKGDSYIDLRINPNYYYRDNDGYMHRGVLIDPNVQGYILDDAPYEEI